MMSKTIDNVKILECEREYSKCFSKMVETENDERSRDDLLPDMHAHNFLLLKTSHTDDELYSQIMDEIRLRRIVNETFCNIVSYVPISDDLLQKIEPKPQMTISGFYVFDSSKFSKLIGRGNCNVSKVNNLTMIEDILRLDLEHEENSSGVDFCIRRVNRRKDVYLSAEGVNSYVCYDNNEAVGNCDLFIYKDIAKIEDFAVSPQKQRQGYGTALLKAIIEIAQSSGACTIYLVTDEEDTAKEMYQKSGFSKIGEKIELLFTV